MQLPFVSRATYDAHTQVLIDAQAALITQNEWMRDAYESLMDKYHALKLQGAAIPERVRHEEPIMPPEILMRAIREVSPKQDTAYTMNYQWAMALKDHWDDEGKMREAAEKIRYGSTYIPDTEMVTIT